MNVTLIDLETVVDVELLDRAEGSYGRFLDDLKIRQDTEHPWVPWYYHRPVVLAGVALRGSRVHAFAYREDDKDTIAKRWWLASSLDAEGKSPSRVITWNGRGFDLPILELDAVRRKLDVSHWMKLPGVKSWEDPRGRFSGQHIDLCDWFANGGAATRPPQNAVAAALGIPGKIGVDGSDVQKLYEDGKIDEIAGYCACDVMTLLAIWCRVVHCLGRNRDRVEPQRWIKHAREQFTAAGYGEHMEKWRRAL